MRTLKIKNLVFAFLLFASSAFASGEKIPDASKLVRFGSQIIQNNGETFLVLNYENYPKWHTYWKNPGDAGLPLKAKFKLNGQEQPLEALEWPAPKLYEEEGGIIAFGYSGAYSLFYRLPERFTSNSTFEVKANWLICLHVCVPGTKTITGTIANKKLTSNSEINISQAEAISRLKNLPKKYTGNDISIILTKSLENKEGLTLYYQLGSLKNPTKLSNHYLLTPFPLEPFDFLQEKSKVIGQAIIAKLPIAWDGDYMEPVEKLPVDGVFKKEKTLKFLLFHPELKKSFIVEKKISKFLINGVEKVDSEFSGVKKKVNNAPIKGETEEPAEKQNLLYILLFAFLGGLILNVMPCVLPVISIKLFGLIKSSQTSQKEIFRHNMFYSLGVLVSFWVLASVILILKNSGESLGWGFQLQSPTFVMIVFLILFVFALNLFGLFEFRLPGSSKLGGMQVKEGASGDFFNGVLATILSTPCSAPFLGAALTYAFTSPGYITLIIFTFMGLGLAFPFILIAFFPNTIKWMPKPGMWMDHLKKFLGLALLLTIVWLFDVFSALVEYSGTILWFNTTVVMTFFWIYYSNKIAQRSYWKIIFLIPVIFFFVKTIQSFPKEGSSQMVSSTGTTIAHGLEWDKWSRENMNKLKGQWVFMDFTAKWCFTCKVNEKLVINTKDFQELIKDKNAKLLLGDWTKKDPEITEFLKENGLVGVPAYFIITPDGKLINLGETITINKIKKNFN